MSMRKKKIELQEVNDLPSIVKGSHLTVTTYSDGHTELEWDDDALLGEVRQAIDNRAVRSVQSDIKSATSSSRRK